MGKIFQASCVTDSQQKHHQHKVETTQTTHYEGLQGNLHVKFQVSCTDQAGNHFKNSKATELTCTTVWIASNMSFLAASVCWCRLRKHGMHSPARASVVHVTSSTPTTARRFEKSRQWNIRFGGSKTMQVKERTYLAEKLRKLTAQTGN